MNNVNLIGNLAANPELRHTAGGKAVCSFRLAVNRGGDRGADFFDIVTWERQAEVVDEYCNKGRKIAVEGRLHQKTWEDKDGNKRNGVEVVAHRVHLLSGARDDAPAPANDTAPEFAPVEGGGSSDDDIPF